ncbi:MAG: peptidase [Gemmatimonadetes bacterium]|nr:peptidase [Gemmatimonadota bacterium]
MTGYPRSPTIHGDTVVFVAEDDLWTVPAGGGGARRLTANLGPTTRPRLSPDGTWIAFAGREEGPPEIYCMPSAGGPAKRLTFLGGCLPAGWSRDGDRILFASSHGKPFDGLHEIYELPREGGHPSPLGTGQALTIALGPHGAIVLGRNGLDAARWKRYRGGTSGRLWIDPTGEGEYRPLIEIDGNLGWPMWIGERLYFLSDHEGIGNIYSCLATGEDLRRHSDHDEFYARNPTTDGERIVYHAGGDLYLLDPDADEPEKIDVRLNSSRTELNRRFASAGDYLASISIHPDGHSLAATIRGQMHTFAGWEGAVLQHGKAHGTRYRSVQWKSSGDHLVCISDETGEESIEIHDIAGDDVPRRLENFDLGLATLMKVSPRGNLAAVANQRFELFLVDLENAAHTLIDRSEFARIGDIAWSPDGDWICYTFGATIQSMQLKLHRVSTGESRDVTAPGFVDLSPSFDPEGKHLYFLSYREFNPVYDSHHFDLGFPHGARPFAIVLQEDAPSPFVPDPRPVGDEMRAKEALQRGENGGTDASKEHEATRIDLEGIDRRVVAFPVPERRYTRIRGGLGKALYTSIPVAGAIEMEFCEIEERPEGVLHMFDMVEQKEERFAEKISSFDVSTDGRIVVYRSGKKRLRLLPTFEAPGSELPEKGRRSGWVDLDRVRVEVDPRSEWRQMFRENWRLIRDNFWTADLSDVDWRRVFRRYEPLLDRIATRSELSDLFWEVQGELGTSHAYEVAGDYRPSPRYDQGLLGADFEFDPDSGAYRITHIVRGDSWAARSDSPLGRPGINISEGDLLVAIGGKKLGASFPPGAAMVHQAGREVALTIRSEPGDRTLSVKALRDESPARYREWVDRNRARVHREGGGRIGYVHVPDMGPHGFAEFHRYYLAEIGKQALIIDARFNRGGHVSQLLLEKLARKPVGYSQPRWGVPEPYPSDSIPGPMVALTNEFAGSDGDIFSHCFKLMKLGPLIGTRTWGGVVGIWPRHALVDGTVTTQPEFSFWFSDVAWDVEGHGTDPDIEVPYRPQDYVAERDPQLERGIAEIITLLRESPESPNLGERPKRTLPTLPPRVRRPAL